MHKLVELNKCVCNVIINNYKEVTRLVFNVQKQSTNCLKQVLINVS